MSASTRSSPSHDDDRDARKSASGAPRQRRNARTRRVRGRTVVALVLVGFVVVASAVIWRRSQGIAHSRMLSDLERQRVQYESEVTRLRGAIRDESSRWRLGPLVEGLGMHVPNDAQVRILPR